MPAQMSLGIDPLPVPSREQLRQAYLRTSLALPFEKAIEKPAIAAAVKGMARAALKKKGRGRRGKR